MRYSVAKLKQSRHDNHILLSCLWEVMDQLKYSPPKKKMMGAVTNVTKCSTTAASGGKNKN